MRNESDKVGSSVHHRPVWIFLIDLSKSISVGTRKMVNYA